jgi:transcription initiation factor TFIIIB Brf1 subunit/transcription initiation factor TFIIB
MTEDFQMQYCGNSLKYDYFQINTSNHSQGISQELEKLQIPDDVKAEANRIFQSMKINIKRGRRRKRIIFYCLYKAFHNLHRTKDPKQIAELVHIHPSETSKAFIQCSEEMINFHTPFDFIGTIVESVGLDPNCIPDIENMLKEILEKDPELQEFYPQVVSAATVLFYIITQGCVVNKREFSKRVKRSEMTINKVFKRIWKVYNS